MTAEYTLKARLAPTALAAPPLLVLCNALFDIKASEWIDSGAMVWLFGKGTASAALVYLMMQINRLIALEIFQRWISKDELDFPTTRWLLATNNDMGEAQRESINKKIKRDFNLTLLPAIDGDTLVVRRHNADIVGRIRAFVGSPQKLLQFNIEYGFFRNLIGASVPVLFICLANSFLYSDGLIPEWAYRLSFAYAIFSGVLICFSRPIIERLGIQYARVLFQEYLHKK